MKRMFVLSWEFHVYHAGLRLFILDIQCFLPWILDIKNDDFVKSSWASWQAFDGA